MKTKATSDGNPFGIRNGQVSVPIYEVSMSRLVASALSYARQHNRTVKIWSNDYRNFREKRFARLEATVLPDGRADSPYVMRIPGGLWCSAGTMRPKGLAACKKAYDGAGPTFCDIYNGWDTQPEIAETEKNPIQS